MIYPSELSYSWLGISIISGSSSFYEVEGKDEGELSEPLLLELELSPELELELEFELELLLESELSSIF